ncbi:ATP-binding protein [Pseudoruegeria sp. SK021]|uniref:sensor histidine kinase n=1 Tax=Pseudoruegeria sp. SK021 TaxID=1933035 RepID=UPI000A2419CE|nr:ATP-binding protein [Pseudoruegeria sp. SK021]OSP55557.1 two-component system sensor histidine kinase [Pseudoruegeria sp. SK021]
MTQIADASLPNPTPVPPAQTRHRLRLFLGLLTVAAAVIIWFTNAVLTERYTTTTRNQSEVRLALFSGSVMSELRRNSIVPQLLSRDPLLIGALGSGDYSQSSQRLIEYREEIGATRIMLLDRNGLTVASSDRADLASDHLSQPYMVEAVVSNTTVFTSVLNDNGLPTFYFSRKIDRQGEEMGVIVVEVDLQKYERSWAGITEAVIVKDSADRILLATEPRWRGRTETEALGTGPAENAFLRAIRARANWFSRDDDPVLGGAGVMRSEGLIPFQGWRIVSYSTFGPVRERVRAAIAVEVMGFAILAAGVFYLTTRQAERHSARLQRESDELKRLNAMLQREISEREKAERNLEVAEQTLAQSSKLTALGEMSAAVSHELNQPLAAMKTYLAGARLLLQRRRSDEAVASLQRINDLIDRMAAITRQLKSYASKSSDRLRRVDMREAVSSSVAMMEPQFRSRRIRITITQPNTEVPVLADRFRLEQVIVNLLRNAVDATRDNNDPEIGLVLSIGRKVSFMVLDNGAGIEDLEALFEPFYSTKSPGEGLGLGLAISSSIVSDLDGRLMARNREGGGAAFEVQLPLYGQEDLAEE